jgi:hypothetical protein
MKMDQRNIDRFLALLLIIGGVAGLIVAVSLWLQASLASLLSLFLIAIFGLSAWVGAGLWREQPHYHVLAQLIFALQVPIVTCSAFTYKFFTAMTLDLSLESAAESKLHVDWELGSKISFVIGPDTPGFVIGVNLLALAALAYLLFVTRKTMDSRGQTLPVSSHGQTAE